MDDDDVRWDALTRLGPHSYVMPMPSYSAPVRSRRSKSFDDNALAVSTVHLTLPHTYRSRAQKSHIEPIMSWAGFKKNVNRATTQVMMKTGHVERTNDRDYEVEER